MEGEDEGGSFESHFRAPSLASDSPLAWALSQRAELVDTLRGLFSGSRSVIQLRLWFFMELAGFPQARISREDLNQLFHALQPQAFESTLKRLRDIGLVIWDGADQTYHLPSLAQQLHGLLAPLAKVADDDDELATLLAHVTGAQALGLVDASQLKHLHAQLARLHDEFAEAIASGSEARLREAQPRFERALSLVERAGQALTALIRTDSEDPRLEREARALGHAQARLLSMASQFNRAMQQADRQRVTLGSTGVTSSDVRQWLREHEALDDLLCDALSIGVHPVFVSQHDLMDVAEGELERDRPDSQRTTGLPPPNTASSGEMQVLGMPAELGDLIDKLSNWRTGQPGTEVEPRSLQDAILGGRFAQAAYRMQLMPLLGDEQAKSLQGQTGQLARSGWLSMFDAVVVPVEDPSVAAMSTGSLEAEEEEHHGRT